MNEFELREDCKNCNGDGGIFSVYPSMYGKCEMIKGGFVTVCFICDGSGKVPWDKIDSVKLDK